MVRTLLMLTLGAAALNGSVAAADVYKFKDEKGNVLYTDKPATLPAERMNVDTRRTDTVATQERQQAELKRMQDADKARTDAATARTAQNAANQLNAKDKAERCTQAKQRFEQYSNSRQLYEMGKDGERRYLSSQEIDAARASAKANMDVMCK